MLFGSGIAVGQTTRPATVRIMDRIAQNHFEAGNEYFQVARYDDAVREFQRAFEISHQTELLFNIARALEAAGDVRGALDAYQRFDQAGAPGFDRDVLHQRMDNLRARIPNASPAPTGGASDSHTSSAPPASPQPATTASASNSPPPAASSPPPVQPATTPAASAAPHSIPIGGIVMLIAGVVVGAGGGVVAYFWSQDSNQVSQANAGALPWSAAVANSYSATGWEGPLAWTLGGVGLACIAVGAALLATGGSSERQPVHAFFAPTQSGAVVGIGGAL